MASTPGVADVGADRSGRILLPELATVVLLMPSLVLRLQREFLKGEGSLHGRRACLFLASAIQYERYTVARTLGNGKSVPVVPAHAGLEAVWVPHGESGVRMKFAARSNGGVRVLAVGGALCSLCLLLYCGVCCVRGFPSARTNDEKPPDPLSI